MRTNRKDSFSFCVSKPRSTKNAKLDETSQMFSFTEGDLPKLKTVTFFGGMTRDECKMLALLIPNGRDFKVKIPHNFEHTSFHGDTLTLTQAELEKHLRDYFGDLNRLPKGCVLSLKKFLEYLLDEVLPSLRVPSINKKLHVHD